MATSRADLGAAAVAKGYDRRFTIEETFRDTKNVHFGMGLLATHIRSSERRDRLLFLGAIAHALLTLLGAAGERCGLDRTFRTNPSNGALSPSTDKVRFWYDAIPAMRDDRLVALMSAHDECVREQAVLREIFGLL